MSSLAHFVFSALVVLLLYLLSLAVSYANCPVFGPLLIMLNSEALKLMLLVCHTNKCVYYLCNSLNAFCQEKNQNFCCLQQYNSG